MLLSTFRFFRDTWSFSGLLSVSRHANFKYFHSLSTLHIYKVHGCCSGPPEALERPCAKLPWRLADFSTVRGVSKSVLRLYSNLQGLGLRISLLSLSNYDKCLPGRLGSGLWRSPSLWSLKGWASIIAHKLPRDAGYVSGFFSKYFKTAMLLSGQTT